MTLFQAIILGIIQGFSEFLPISSSGHLALTAWLFGLNEGDLFFVVTIHIGTLVPVFIFYRKDILQLIRKPFQKMTYLLIVATLPAVVIALLFEDHIDAAFTAMGFLSVGFAITAVVLLLTDKIKNSNKKSQDISYVDALLVGIAQGAAVFPGISRSGSTIVAALARGIKREDAARFSFLMSIPAILGAMVLQISHIFRGNIALYQLDFVNLGAGFVAAMLSGYLAIQLMLNIVKKAKLRYFACYMFFIAAFTGAMVILL